MKLQSGVAAGPDVAARAIGKTNRRLIPFLAIMLAIALIDRGNIGFAKAGLEADVGIGSAAYGFGAGVFFIGYLVFEVPSNLILHRIGARVWLSRIMVTWGIIAAAMMFVQGPWSLYILRFLLGVAEAGLFPGLVLYISYWYPERHRSTPLGIMYWGLPLAVIIGGPLAGVLLSFDGAASLQGWQWLFLVEGLIAVVFGIFAFFYLDDKPADASWLTSDEREALQAQVREDEQTRESQQSLSVVQALLNPKVLYFTLIYFLLTLSTWGVTFWLPSLVSDIGGLSSLQIGFITAIPWACAAVALYIASRSTDRTGKPKQVGAICLVAASVGFAISASVGPVMAIVALCLATAGFVAVFPVFWTLPASYLTGAAAAAGIALINSIGNVSGLVAPVAFGLIEEATGTVVIGLYGLATAAIIAAVLILLVKHQTLSGSGARDSKSGVEEVSSQ